MASFAFDSTTVEPQSSIREVIPAGNYTAMITETEIKDTKSGTGQYIRCTYQILDGEYKNRKIWSNFNIRNSNPQAEQIGKAQLASAVQAMGLTRISDTAELHNKPLVIKVKVRKQDGYEDTNDVAGFGKAEGVAPVSLVAAAAKPASATPPWVRK
jgi:hypothetical protein